MNAIPPRRRLLDAALELFNRNGYAATSQAEIAGAAGIRQGNLTYHFPAKLDLVGDCEDFMNNQLDCSERRTFKGTDAACVDASDVPTECRCGGATQNTYQSLLAATTCAP